MIYPQLAANLTEDIRLSGLTASMNEQGAFPTIYRCSSRTDLRERTLGPWRAH